MKPFVPATKSGEQIRNVPDGVHATLKSRVALAGQPLTEYLLAEIRRVAERPTPEELANRLLRRPSVRLKTASASRQRPPQDSAASRQRRPRR